MMYISVASNSQHINKILKKAKSLGLSSKEEISWDDGFRYGDKSNRQITVFDHSEELFEFIKDLEVIVDLSKKSKLLGTHLTLPSPEETIKIGY